MSLWARTRERDHRDYAYLVTDRMDQALWLQRYNRIEGSMGDGYRFLSKGPITESGGWGGTYEFDVYEVVDGKPEHVDGQFSIEFGVFKDDAFIKAFTEAFPLKEAKND